MKETVKILGRHITVKSDSDDPKYVQEVADFVNRLGMRLEKDHPSVRTEQIALMAAMEIADEHFKKQASSLEANSAARHRITKLIEKIQRAL